MIAIIPKVSFFCENCDREFTTDTECLAHEKACRKINMFLCSKCGEGIKYIDNKVNDFESFNTAEEMNLLIANERCWPIDLEIHGYGSKLDGLHVSFNLCDDCLYNLIQTFTSNAKESILRSYNYYQLGLRDRLRTDDNNLD